MLTGRQEARHVVVFPIRLRRCERAPIPRSTEGQASSPSALLLFADGCGDGGRQLAMLITDETTRAVHMPTTLSKDPTLGGKG